MNTETSEDLLKDYRERKEQERIERYNPDKYSIKPEPIPNEIQWTSLHNHVCNGYLQRWIKLRTNEELLPLSNNPSKFTAYFAERFAKFVIGLSRLIYQDQKTCLELLCAELGDPHTFPKEGDHYKKIKTQGRGGIEEDYHPMDCCYVGRISQQILYNLVPKEYEAMNKL